MVCCPPWVGVPEGYACCHYSNFLFEYFSNIGKAHVFEYILSSKVCVILVYRLINTRAKLVPYPGKKCEVPVARDCY